MAGLAEVVHQHSLLDGVKRLVSEASTDIGHIRRVPIIAVDLDMVPARSLHGGDLGRRPQRDEIHANGGRHREFQRRQLRAPSARPCLSAPASALSLWPAVPPAAQHELGRAFNHHQRLLVGRGVHRHFAIRAAAVRMNHRGHAVQCKSDRAAVRIDGHRHIEFFGRRTQTQDGPDIFQRRRRGTAESTGSVTASGGESPQRATRIEIAGATRTRLRLFSAGGDATTVTPRTGSLP